MSCFFRTTNFGKQYYQSVSLASIGQIPHLDKNSENISNDKAWNKCKDVSALAKTKITGIPIVQKSQAKTTKLTRLPSQERNPAIESLRQSLEELPLIMAGFNRAMVTFDKLGQDLQCSSKLLKLTRRAAAQGDRAKFKKNPSLWANHQKRFLSNKPDNSRLTHYQLKRKRAQNHAIFATQQRWLSEGKGFIRY